LGTGNYSLNVSGISLAEIEGNLGDLSRALASDGVRLACLFGSVLEGSSARDVDLAVLFREYRFDKYLETLEAACRALGTREVDLVVLNRANPRLKLRALVEGRLVFAEAPTAKIEAIAEALFEYEDYRRFMLQYRYHLDRRCREGLSVVDRKMDEERVEGYLSTLDEAIAQLRRLRERFVSYEEFRSDVDTRELCVHYLRIGLESVLDMCRHFLAVVGVSLTELDTSNLIELAGDKGLLEPAFARRIRGMAGMRNAIVHVYWRLDYQAIYRAVTEELVDFDEFARQVRAYLRG
jgi:uncharacterized protein YutE (UPF0331/DUF86 family)/predicted nucleotidyltransferase